MIERLKRSPKIHTRQPENFRRLEFHYPLDKHLREIYKPEYLPY